MKSSKIVTDPSSPKTSTHSKKKRMQTAEGWRRSVKKICDKRQSKKDEK